MIEWDEKTLGLITKGHPAEKIVLKRNFMEGLAGTKNIWYGSHGIRYSQTEMKAYFEVKFYHPKRSNVSPVDVTLMWRDSKLCVRFHADGFLYTDIEFYEDLHSAVKEAEQVLKGIVENKELQEKLSKEGFKIA